MLTFHAGEYSGNIVNKLNIDGCLISTTHYEAVNSNPASHYHENSHLCFVYEIGEAQTKRNVRQSTGQGDIFYYHAEETHRWISPSPISKSANIEIAPSFIKKYDINASQLKNAIIKKVHSKALLLKIQNEMLHFEQGNVESIKTLLLELFNYSTQSNSLKKPHWITSVDDFLQDNWNADISLEEIAYAVNIHPVTISKYFRRYFHSTLSEYRRQLKVKRSIQMIKQSKLSLTEISHQCGFTDQSHFTKVFKHSTGFLPKNFKKY